MKKTDGSFYGYCAELAELLKDAFSFNYELRLVPDEKYGAKNANGTWNGMIGVLRREVPTTVTNCSL